MTENATATTTIGKMVRRTIPLVLALFLTQNMAAQLKQFTLEDLNFGGNNYHNMRPKNMYLRRAARLPSPRSTRSTRPWATARWPQP